MKHSSKTWSTLVKLVNIMHKGFAKRKTIARFGMTLLLMLTTVNMLDLCWTYWVMLSIMFMPLDDKKIQGQPFNILQSMPFVKVFAVLFVPVWGVLVIVTSETNLCWSRAIGDWVIKRRCFHCISGRCIWYLRLGWGICSSLWCLSSPQALLVNTALLLSALKRILAFVPNNLSSSGRRNDSCVVLLACWRATLSAQPSPDTLWLCLFWRMGLFSGNSISRRLCEWFTPARCEAGWNGCSCCNPHTHAHTQVAAVSTWDLLQSLSHLHRRFTVQAVMFRGLYLLRQMFTVLAELQLAIIFTSGPWGILKAC